MWVMMKLKRTGEVVYFQGYDSKEAAVFDVKFLL